MNYLYEITKVEQNRAYMNYSSSDMTDYLRKGTVEHFHLVSFNSPVCITYLFFRRKDYISYHEPYLVPVLKIKYF